jgi:diguanylate cyclase (GGDEF)-like protein
LLTGTWAAWLLACALAFAFMVPGLARSAEPQANSLRLAVTEAPTETSLEDIVNGSARVGFTPVVERGLSVVGRSGQTIWLRLRMELPAAGEARFISLPRQTIDHLRLHQAGPPDLVTAETGIDQPSRLSRWPDAFVLPIPAAASGDTTLYLEVQGKGHLNLQPQLLSEEQVQAQANASGRFYDVLYGSLLLVGLLGLVLRWAKGERTFRVALGAFACLGAGIVGNQHLLLAVGGTSLASIPALPTAMWVLACAPLLWATQQYAGHEKQRPELAVALDRTGFAFLAIGLLMLFMPAQFLAQLQVTSTVLLTITALVCAASLSYDTRKWRWGPILIWLLFVPVLMAIPLAMMQVVHGSLAVRRGFQLLLALQLAIYLLLPWFRQRQQDRLGLKLGGKSPQSAEDKIAHAREWMISSLQAGIANSADDGDMEWIAYRRLMGGLMTVLPQSSAAVIAMNYHNEDLLLVEPKTAEPNFQLLLAQRASLLKNLSRSLAPQQIGVDFIGPEGSPRHILLAVIPLPIVRPGWGLLVIERNPKVTYSDGELDLCTEFAALATTAGDEAAVAMQRRQANEIDAESGVYKREMIDQVLGQAHEQALQKRKALSILRIGIDAFDGLPADASAKLMRRLADLTRDEIDYGETIGRFVDDELLVLLYGRSIGDARALAERICAAVRKLALPAADGAMLQVSIGVSQMQPGERSSQFLLERAAKALAKARQYGGNQVQAIAGAV